MTHHAGINRRSFVNEVLSGGTLAVAGTGWLIGAEQTAASVPKGQYEIGIYTRPWEQHDYRVALDQIAAAGFQHAGLMTCKGRPGNLVLSADTTVDEAAAIGEEVKRRGLKVPSVYGGGIPVAKSLEAGIDGMRRLIDNCVAAGAKSLLMGGSGAEKLYDVYYKAIAETCDYAAEKGLPITVKPHGGLNATGPQCRKCIELVGHKNFSLWYDPGNIFFYSDGQLDPVDDAATVDGLVTVGMCIKDFDRTLKAGKPTRNVALTPGTGKVDFLRVLGTLRRGGFTGGYLVIECLAPGDGSLPTILAEARKAREYVEGLIARL